MRKKTKVFSKTAIATAIATVAVIPVVASPAAAAETEIKEVVYIIDGQNVSLDFSQFTSALNAGLLNVTNIEFIQASNNSYYTFADFTSALNAATSEESNTGEILTATFKYLDEAPELIQTITTVPGTIEGGQIIPPPINTIVKTVSAITGKTIAEGEETTLKFLVNGEELTKSEFEAKYEGYTAEFKYNFSGATTKERAGLVSKTESFKYAVQVTDAEGKLLPETLKAADYAEVTVISALTPVSVSGVELSNDLTYITLGEKATIKLVSALNAFGDELEELELEDLEPTIESSDVTVAYANGTSVVTRKAGTATFTVKFPAESKIAPVTIKVEVKDAQKATSISAKDLKVETASDLEYSSEFTLLDQYGEEFRTTEPKTTVVVTNAAGEEVNSFAEEDVYTVAVYLEENKTTKLGSYKVTTVDVAEGTADTFKFSVGEDFKLDLVNDSSKTGSVVLAGYIDGVKLTSLEGQLKGYKLVSSNEKVITVNQTPTASNIVTAKAVGKSTLSLVKVEGDIETVKATIELTVANSTPQINSLTLKNNKSSIVVNDPTIANLSNAISGQVTAGKDKDGKEIFNVNMIAKDGIEYVAANKKVIVTLDALYGGKEFIFDVVADTTSPTITSATVGAEANVGIIDENNRITFTVDTTAYYKTGTVAFSEEITKATITTIDKEPVDVVLEGTNVLDALLDMFKPLDGDVTGQTLITNSGAKVTLTDTAGNTNDYTVIFTAQ